MCCYRRRNAGCSRPLKTKDQGASAVTLVDMGHAGNTGNDLDLLGYMYVTRSRLASWRNFGPSLKRRVSQDAD
jgi:hypothetical protein